MINALSEEYDVSEYFKEVDLYNDLVLASYLGGKRVIFEEGQQPQFISPSMLLVFSSAGDLVKRIDVGHTFSSFCIDEDNDRVILYFDDRESALGYFSLNGILN